MAGIRITAQFKNIRKGFFSPEVANRLTQKQLQKGMDATLKGATRIARDYTPVGATGQLRDSVHAYTDTVIGDRSIIGRVAWDSVYANAVDQGTPPHWVPIGPLLEWAAVKLGDANLAYPVQRKIAAEGTTGYEFVEVTRLEIEVVFRKNIDRMAANLTNDLEKDY